MSAYREIANAPRLAWEYKVLRFDVEAGLRDGRAEPVLNELGAAGWEIAGISPMHQMASIVYTLKRLRE
jgi:hypothetical protein